MGYTAEEGVWFARVSSAGVSVSSVVLQKSLTIRCGLAARNPKGWCEWQGIFEALR